MTIKTYEIHNSYLKYAPDSHGITRMVSEEDYISQLQQTDALQTSLNNIINAFGISGEGAHSKLVIEYVHGLVAENVAMRGAIEFAEPWLPSCDGELLHIISQAKITPATEEFTAELRAQGVDEFTTKLGAKAAILSTSSNVYKVLKSIIFSGVEFAANLRAGRKG